MKCPTCQSKQRQREGKTCKSCGYEYAFSPRDSTTGNLTDWKFLATIKKASNSGKDYFTFNQLYGAFVSSADGIRLLSVPLQIALSVAIGVAYLFVGNWALLGLLPVACLVYFLILNPPNVMSRDKFHICLQKWRDRGRTIKGLIENPILHDPPPQWRESDIYAYGVERILIVQRDLLVDLFVLNNLHSEHRMLVVSMTGYPEYIAARVPNLLAENPNLPIFLLHDADETGQKMHKTVANLEWLSQPHRPVIDLGFFPEDFVKLNRTRKLRLHAGNAHLPADAVLAGTLSLGIGACFLTQATFADELMREKANTFDSGSDFG